MWDVAGIIKRAVTVEIFDEDRRKVTTLEGMLVDDQVQVGNFSVSFDGEVINMKGASIQIGINNQQEVVDEFLMRHKELKELSTPTPSPTVGAASDAECLKYGSKEIT